MAASRYSLRSMKVLLKKTFLVRVGIRFGSPGPGIIQGLTEKRKELSASPPNDRRHPRLTNFGADIAAAETPRCPLGMVEAWYATPMTTTIDKAGRVVIPVEVRKRLGLTAGAELEMVIEGFSIRLARAVAGPQLVRRGERLIARPQAAEGERTEVDVARLIDEERDRWPG